MNTIQVQRHAFWVRCVRMIVEMTTADIPRLRRRLLANRDACFSKIHELSMPDHLQDPIFAVVDALYLIVIAGLTRGMRPLQPRAETFKYFHKRKGHWPVSLEQLFPLGVQRAVDALVFWCCVPTWPRQFSLLTSMLLVARALVMPCLLESPSRDCLVWSIVRALAPGSFSWPQIAAPFTAPPGLALTEDLRGDPRMTIVVAEFLSQLRDDLNARGSDVVRFLLGYESPVVAALERIPRDVTAEIDMGIVHEYVHLLRGRPDLSDAVSMIHEFLLRRSMSRLCANAACARSELADDGTVRRFQQCGSCMFARYCSRTCQRHDWTAGAGAHHKAICPILCTLLAAADPFLESDDFRREFEALGLDDKDLRALHEWSLAGGLLAPRGCAQDSRSSSVS